MKGSRQSKAHLSYLGEGFVIISVSFVVRAEVMLGGQRSAERAR